MNYAAPSGPGLPAKPLGLPVVRPYVGTSLETGDKARSSLVGDNVRRGAREGRYLRRRQLAVLTIAMLVSLGATVPALAEEGSVEPQVVGGTPVPDGKYPFMISLQADTSQRPPY
jgi:hypothetical protein